VPGLPPDARPGTDESDGLYTMAVASRLTGMHPQTLRKYERAGLIRPARQSGNQRLYSEADVRRLRRIRYLVEVRGVNIAGLELTLRMADRLDALGSEPTPAELQDAVDQVADMSREPRRTPRHAEHDPRG
jgi:MerR family transcriptional regulator/heat shock protein HspR